VLAWRDWWHWGDGAVDNEDVAFVEFVLLCCDYY
jgi:hypothetical protein